MMKQIITVVILMFSGLSGNSQTFSGASFIEPYPLEVTTNKTTNLVFPFAIKSIDRGSANILVQKAGYVDTILQVKAARQDFVETNLSVITTDGKLYSFLIRYSPTPVHLNYHFQGSNNSIKDALGATNIDDATIDNEADFLANAKLIAGNKKFIHGVKSNQYKIQLQLEGVYITNGNLYFQLHVKNNSNIPYSIEQLRFQLRDKKQGRRTSQQEIDIHPVHRYGNSNRIEANSANRCVFVFPAFTIANSKYFVITMSEKNGGRTLDIKVKNKQLLQARKIN
jgi:conjugative transposon TraN protein